MPVNFPNSPSNDDEHSANGLIYKYNSTKGAWKRKFVAPTDATDINQLTDSSGLLTSSSTNVVADMAALIALTGMSSGDQAYVTANNKLYFYNGSGWYFIATVQNDAPSAITGVNGTYELAVDGTATTITAVSTDPEGFPLTWSYSTSGLGSIATVSNTDGVFTITPSTTIADAGTFTLTINATDGINGAVSTSTNLTLEFIVTVTNSKYTTLLATATGTSDNDNIIDSSANNHTPTLINPADALSQGSFSPYRSGGYSTSFPGASSDYLQVENLQHSFGTNDFTIEFFAYITANYSVLFDFKDNPERFRLATNNNNGGSSSDAAARLRLNWYKEGTGQVTTYSTDNAINKNQWNHIAVCRSGSSMKMFANGNEVYSESVGGNYDYGSANTTDMQIGRWNSTGDVLNGKISNFRIINNSALYNGSYTVPTENFTAQSGTVLLTCHLPYISDGSTNAHTITVNGEVSTKPFSPYDYEEYSATDHGGSIQSTNSDDTSSGRTGLSFADHADFDLAGSDWTFEWWAYVPKSEGVHNHNFIKKGPQGAIRPYSFNYRLESGQPGWEPRMFGSSDGSSQWEGYSGSAWQPWSTWTHVAFVRNGSTITRYINGKAYGTGTGDVFDNNEVLYVGGGIGDEQPHTYSDLRISKSAVYTSEFTPPTAPISSSGSVLHLKGANASIIDKSQGGNLKLIGDTTGSTTQAKFSNTKSMYFDGTGDRATATGVTDLGDDFTIECWLYSTTTGNRAIVSSIDNVGSWGSNGYWSFGCYGGTPQLQIDGGSYSGASTSLPTNQWVHLAVTRTSNTVRSFIDGTLDSTTFSNSLTLKNPSGIVIGSSPNNNYIYNYTGYMQDLRISNECKYTANFTPPTASLEG